MGTQFSDGISLRTVFLLAGIMLASLLVIAVSRHEGDTMITTANAATSKPLIDRSRPAKFETATFALG